MTDHVEDCPLCEAAKLTERYYEDDLVWAADCASCGVPMVVRQKHDIAPTQEERDRLLLGGFLTIRALSGVGEGGISVISKALGEITGINGQLVIFLAGIFMVMSALGYARKAFQEARQYETSTIQDTVRHFSPVD